MIEFIFILVEPGEPGNIGAAARALHTMGFPDLRFVRPQADVLSEVARAFAHGSVHLLESAPIYESLQAAVVDVDVVCGCTARHRIEKYHYVSVRELPEVLQEKGDRLKKVAIVFGSERSGLSNQDVDLCDIVTTIPQAVAQPSLNLAQAVMVYSFTLAEQQTQIQIKDQRLNTDQMPVEQYARLKASLAQLMERVGLSKRYQGYVRRSLSRLGYEDLYLVQNIRTVVNNKLNELERE